MYLYFLMQIKLCKNDQMLKSVTSFSAPYVALLILFSPETSIDMTPTKFGHFSF